MRSLTPGQADQLAVEAAGETLALSPLPASGIDNDDHGFVDRAATTYKGRIIGAKDLMEFSPQPEIPFRGCPAWVNGSGWTHAAGQLGSAEQTWHMSRSAAVLIP